MDYSFLKFLHVGSMFLATALAVGPSALLYMSVREQDASTVRRSIASTARIYRAAALFYGLGVVFGVIAALNGSLDLTAAWLLAAYALIVVLIGFNLTFERWTHRLDEAAAANPSALTAVKSASIARYALSGMILVTIAIVFVMVVKPSLPN